MLQLIRRSLFWAERPNRLKSCFQASWSSLFELFSQPGLGCPAGAECVQQTRLSPQRLDVHLNFVLPHARN